MSKQPHKFNTGWEGSDHYREGGIEVIDILRAKMVGEQFEGFLLGNIIKYSLRANFAGKKEADIKKCKHYCEMLLEHLTLERK